MMTKKLAAGIALLALVVYFLSQHLTLSWRQDAQSASPLPAIKQTTADPVRVCPMHPEIMQHQPGQCPICGMDLVEAESGSTHQHGIQVDAATVQRLGVRLARVKTAVVSQELATYGNVVVDESTTFTVQPKYEGWVKKLHVHAIGETVRAGQVLYEIYSPELLIRQRTYLSSIERRKQLLQTIPTTPDTESDYVMEMAMDAANDRKKLHIEEGMSIEAILDIERTKMAKEVVPVIAARGGVVSQIGIREGAFVAAATPMLTLADVGKVWIEVALYPDQVGQVRVGDAVTIKEAGGRVIQARLNFISPLAENNKATARVRLDNGAYRLRPGSFVDVVMHARPHSGLVVPRSAVMFTGSGNQVMLARGDGHFLPVPVETGSETGDQIELLEGVLEGAEVALNGQFLLDAAATMSAATERMRAR